MLVRLSYGFIYRNLPLGHYPPLTFSAGARGATGPGFDSCQGTSGYGHSIGLLLTVGGKTERNWNGTQR